MDFVKVTSVPISVVVSEIRIHMASMYFFTITEQILTR